MNSNDINPPSFHIYINWNDGSINNVLKIFLLVIMGLVTIEPMKNRKTYKLF